MAFYNIRPTKIINTEIPTTTGILSTVDAGTVEFIKDINIANNNATTVNVSVYLVDSGGSPGNSNSLLGNVEILGNDVAQWTGAQIIEEGDTIQAVSDTSGVCIKVSGGVAT